MLFKLTDQDLNVLKQRLLFLITTLGFLIVTSVSLSYSSIAFVESKITWGPQWTKNDELKLPENYHSWIFLGAPLTPNALNNGKAGFP
jgi:hypothetical protein